MSASAARSASSPSTFALILRQTQFASFDPQIGQVYGTHNGHAHRGDYGFKRPFSNRRRDGRITVKSVDTRHQQTEWRSAFLDSKFIQKQQETGSVVSLQNGFDRGRNSSWARTLGPSAGSSGPWHVYSEFAMGPSGEEGEARRKEEARLAAETEGMETLPNLQAMTDSQFNSYARKARKLHSAHLKSVRQTQHKTTQNTLTSNMTRRINEGSYVRFLVNEHAKRSSNPSSSFIRPLPHANAGLEYTHAPSMQQYFFSNPLPGRRLQVNLGTRNRANSQVISMGGWAGHEFLKTSERGSITDFNGENGLGRQNREAGKAKFRVAEQHLLDPPKVVDQMPQTMQDAQLSRTVMTHEDWEERRHRLNPHTPGSREYVAHVEQLVQDEVAHPGARAYMTKSPTYSRKSKDADAPISPNGVLNTLSHILSKANLKETGSGNEP